uniref:Large ribosomal subunit protein uL15m n=1 Tax=Syphacia muris TaxID=451379 RepID=A0A0N5AL37_9BILA
MSSAKILKSASERALRYVEESGRLTLADLYDNPGARTKGRMVRATMNQAGHTIGQLQHAAKPPLGWVWGDFYKPWQRIFPGEKYFNGDINLRREYQPLSLLELQRLIDLGWLSTNRLIDLTALCNTKRYSCNPSLRQFGVQLTDEGVDVFSACINLEVQWASQAAIAAVERAGGNIRTAYYDVQSLQAVVNPKKWFLEGNVIPRRKAPPAELMLYYMDPKNRGYLAKKDEIETAEKDLADLYGYERKRIKNLEEKAVDQVFYGIPSGSIVSLTDKKVFVPTDEKLRRYYGLSRSGDDEMEADHSYA